jgi:5-methylcytosine-specific restriction endonuclease McrA
LTGYEVRRIGAEGSGFLYGAFEADRLVAEAFHKDERRALALLVTQIYRMHGELVCQMHDWRCARCRRPRGLQIHHRRFRSHGGTHRPENLEPVCWECHDRIHRSERSQ